MPSDIPYCPQCGALKYSEISFEYIPAERPGPGTVSIYNIRLRMSCKKCGKPVSYKE